MEKKLYKSVNDKKLAGVCGGFAEYFGVDPTWVRIGWAIISLAWGTGILLYIVCIFVMSDGPQ